MGIWFRISLSSFSFLQQITLGPRIQILSFGFNIQKILHHIIIIISFFFVLLLFLQKEKQDENTQEFKD